MNCCNDFGQCTQGRNCPARVAHIGKQTPAGELVPVSTWRDHLADLARAMLLVIFVMSLGAIAVAVLVL